MASLMTEKTGIGRLWTLLTGERGEYELSLGRTLTAQEMLNALANFANAGRMIPEQVWDRSDLEAKVSAGSGTGSATPLAWSMAEFYSPRGEHRTRQES
jgi:glucoamylase